MARPKGKFLALIAVFAAIGLVTATGAFTSVSAQRSVTVNVAGDDAALLQLNPSGTYSYVSLNNDGELEIDLSSSSTSSEGAEGVNPNARTEIDGIFTITNQGEETVEIYISKSGTNAASVQLEDSTDTALPTTDGSGKTLSSGDSITVGLTVDTTSNSPGSTELTDSATISVTITINADQV